MARADDAPLVVRLMISTDECVERRIGAQWRLLTFDKVELRRSVNSLVPDRYMT